MIDIGGAIISGLLGCGGIIGFAQFLISRHDQKKSEIKEVKECLGSMKKTFENDLAEIKQSQDDTNIRVTRMELKSLIREDPENVDAILQVAQTYFVELNGNAYAHVLFEKWAKEHDQPIGWLPKLKISKK